MLTAITVILRTAHGQNIIASRSSLFGDEVPEAEELLRRQMDLWERSDQFVGQPLEVITVREQLR